MNVGRTGRKLLRHVVRHSSVDIAGLASAAGCTPDVARAGILRLYETGVLRGLRPDIDPRAVGDYEMVVSAVPGKRTDRAALDRLAAAPGVSRLYTVAARASVVFHVVDTSLVRATQRCATLAGEAGFDHHDALLVVQVLLDDPIAPLTKATDPPAGTTPDGA